MSAPVPTAVEAERQVLGACLVSQEAWSIARRALSNDDWFAPAHEHIWAAMQELDAQGFPIEPTAVMTQMTKNASLGRSGGAEYLAALVGALHTAANVGYHADLIAQAAVRRRLQTAGIHLEQLSRQDDIDVAEVLDQARVELDLVRGMRRGDDAIPGLMSYHDYIATYAGRPGNWVVPGVIGRRDVWMILAQAGHGKTMLSRHVMWAIAAGRNPWALGELIEPKRVLLVDLENDPGMGADETVDYFARYDALGPGVEDRAFIWTQTAGLNLRKQADALLFDDVVHWYRPDLICLGSLYKSFSRSGDWDQCANEAREVFDQLRDRHNVAFWLEHHMPKGAAGEKRQTPFGSSVWEWWTSHGRVLERAVPDNINSPFKFHAAFRGDRGRREGPVGFTKGGRYLWDPIHDESELDVLIDAAAPVVPQFRERFVG